MEAPDARGASINSDGPAVDPEFDLNTSMAVEGVRVEGGSINVVGANAVVRNNTVAQDDAHYFAAVAVYGPRPSVSGNIVEWNMTSSRGHSKVYGIYLRYANGAILHDNKIENHGPQHDTVGIAIRNSQAVQIERTEIINFSAKVEVIGKIAAQTKEDLAH